MKRWAVVLSGGEGQRMESFIRRWLGHPRPKQYCSFAGGRTMLEHTYARALAATDPERVVTVVGRGHRRFMESPRRIEIPGRLIEQPQRCDTGPGVFLPLTWVMARDPDAVVAIMPSDHFIHPLERFHVLLDEAYRLAQSLPRQVVLLAAAPERSERDYGWIVPGPAVAGSGAVRVARFKEKPPSREAALLHRHGGLWNTMIVVARVRALWGLGRGLHPRMMERFEALRGEMGRPGEAEALARAYRDMESINFSRDFLEAIADRTVALPMTDIHWSDWGRPQRVVETLSRIGRCQSFPAALAQAAA